MFVRPQFLLFYLNVGPHLQLQYMKIHVEAFPQSCRCLSYVSFATLFCRREAKFFFFAKLQLKKFWAWAETNTGLCWGRIKAKVLDEFQTFWIFNMFTRLNSIPSFVLATGVMGLNMKMWTCWNSNIVKIF